MKRITHRLRSHLFLNKIITSLNMWVYNYKRLISGLRSSRLSRNRIHLRKKWINFLRRRKILKKLPIFLSNRKSWLIFIWFQIRMEMGKRLLLLLRLLSRKWKFRLTILRAVLIFIVNLPAELALSLINMNSLWIIDLEFKAEMLRGRGVRKGLMSLLKVSRERRDVRIGRVSIKLTLMT